MLEFNLSKSSHKRSRTYKKFPRYKLKEDSTPLNLKEWGFCKNNWNDDDYTYVKGNIKKFLMHNIGKPFEKVYSKFLKRWKAGNRYNPREELYSYIKNKESISSYLGGFYLTDGILNYLKPQQIQQKKDYSKLNAKRFNELDLVNLVKSLECTEVPQYLGKYYIGEEEKSIYLDNHWIKTENPNYTLVRIAGVGNGLSIDFIKKTSGFVKEYKVVNCAGVPLFFFYYKNQLI